MRRVLRAASGFGFTGAFAWLVWVIVLAIVLSPRALAANTDVWTGGGGDNNFKTPSNWAGTIVPSPGDTLVFDGNNRFTPNDNFAAGTVFGGITFASTAAGPFNVGGNQIALNG